MNDLENTRPTKNFIEQAIDADLESGRYQGVFTSFSTRTEWLSAHRSC